MKFTAYARRDGAPRPVEMSWLDFEALLMRDPPIIANPDDRPAFGPHTLRGLRRLKAEVLTVCMMVHDFDHLTSSDVERLLAKVARFQGLVYTTYNHGGTKGIALRLILPHAPLEPHRWEKARKRFLTFLQVPDDPATQDASRLFYIPCSRPGAPPPMFCKLTGTPFDPNRLPGDRKISIGDFETLCKALNNKRHHATTEDAKARLTDAAHALKMIVHRLPYADRGNIDNTMFTLASQMLRAWGPDTDTESILEIMSDSLSQMPPDSRHDHARDKLERLFGEARADALEDTEERVRQHFKALGISRTEPYTHEEVVYMRDTYCDKDHMAFIVQANNAIYGLTIDGYRPRGRADQMPDMTRALCAFTQVDFRDPSGSVKSVKTLLENYGQRADTVEYSYLQDRSSFDGSKFTIATAQRRQITPLYDPEIDTWIGILGGSKHLALRQWLAWLPHLDRPLMALFFHGPPGTGKSLFVTAISRLWGDTTKMSAALAQDDGFNEELLYSPLCWADEKFPRHRLGGAYKTEEFRELIQAQYHKINGKNKAIVTLRGHVRCVLTANNQNMFKMASNVMTREDFEAVTERVLRIPVSEASRTYLRRLDVASIAETDRVAAHILTMPRPEAMNRFGIDPQPVDYSLVVGQFLPGMLCQHLLDLLASKGMPPGITVLEGAVHLLPTCVKLTSDIKIKAPQLFDAISTVSEGRKAIGQSAAIQIAGNYHRISPEALSEYARSAGYADDWIAERLAFHEYHHVSRRAN